MYLTKEQQKELNEEFKKKSSIKKILWFLWLFFIVLPMFLIYNFFFIIFNFLLLPFQVIKDFIKNRKSIFKAMEDN